MHTPSLLSECLQRSMMSSHKNTPFILQHKEHVYHPLAYLKAFPHLVPCKYPPVFLETATDFLLIIFYGVRSFLKATTAK